MPTHGVQATNLWSSTAPSTQVTNTTQTWVGLKISFPAPGRVCGFRAYRKNGTGDAKIGVLINASTSTLLVAKHFRDTPATANAWQQTWFRPWVRINTTDDFLVAVTYAGVNYYRTVGALATALTNGGITAFAGFQTTALDVSGATLTTNTNANGVDILFQAD